MTVKDKSEDIDVNVGEVHTMHIIKDVLGVVRNIFGLRRFIFYFKDEREK